jgi:hypothetical protein
LVDPTARALTWAQIAVHHQWIDDQLAVPVTVATIAQRLRDDHRVEVSESTVRHYIATTFTEARLEGKVTVPRGAVEAGQRSPDRLRPPRDVVHQEKLDTTVRRSPMDTV